MALVEGGGIQHILQSTASSLTVQFYNYGAAADPGTVTVAITRADGTTLTPTAGSTATGDGSDPRTLALTAAETANLDILNVTWRSGTLGVLRTEVHIIGAFLFTIQEARTFQANKAGGAPLANAGKYPTDAIENARARITDEFERLAGVSFVPRYHRVTVNGSGTSALRIDDREVTTLRSVESRTTGSGTWTASSGGDVALLLVESYGVITSETTTFTSGGRNYRIGYEAGFATVPADVKQAALIALADELVESNVSSRAISISDDHGSTQLWTVGLSGRGMAIHRIPYVDAVLRGYSAIAPAIA